MKIKCPICENIDVKVVYKDFPAYKTDLQYDICYCMNCDTSFADPLIIEDKTYEYIYKEGSNTPGYQRYYWYRDKVKTFIKPLFFLSQVEDVYWGVQEYLIQNKNPEIKILEVGCGLGYLTYSLNKANYNTVGLDISLNAIEKARQNFGDYYECADVFDYSVSNKKRYDVIILTEVIEHIIDPVSFIKNLLDMLTDGGEIIITTPNKDSSYNAGEYWDTELPPVHLWWFSTKSFHSIAKRCNLNLDQYDLSRFYSRKKKYMKVVDNHKPWRTQTFDENGKLLFKERKGILMRIAKEVTIKLGVWQSIETFKNIVLRNRGDVAMKSDKIMAIFSPKRG
jgi:SAM-dependent methyltransferase